MPVNWELDLALKFSWDFGIGRNLAVTGKEL